jgi:LSD1 subclass zinc finger protein
MEDQVLLEEKLSCKGCGASLEYSAGTQALKCQYCSAITEIEREEERLDDGPRMIVPLTVEKRDLEQAVHTLLASGDYTPDDLLEQAVFTKVERFYAAAYIFDGQFDAIWTASFGYDRTEHYTAFETRYSNGHSRQVPVTKTKTVTDWSPVNGSDTGEFAVIGYAGGRLSGNTLSLVEYCNGGHKATDYKPSFASGVEIEAFSLTDAAAYSQRGEAQVNDIIDRSVKSHAQGHRQRDWHWTANIAKKSIPVAVPVCHVVYEYAGKSYHVWTDGTDASHQVSDPLPQDQNRQKKVRLGFIPGAAATTALLAAGLMSNPGGLFEAFSWSTVGATAGAWGYGLWRRHAILNHSRQLRQALLAEKTASRSNLSHISETDGAELADSFQRPKKPWMLDARKDKRGLIISSIVFSLLVLFIALAQYRSSHPSTYVADPEPASAPAAAPAEQPAPAPVVATPEAAAPAEPQAAAAEAATPAAAPVAEEPTPAAAPAEEAANAQANPPVQDARTVQSLIAMLNAASQGDWNTVDAKVQLIRQSPEVTRGDRQAARAANNEGLNALQHNEYDRAIAAFGRAAGADPGDAEARNNLAFAHLQTKDFSKALDTSGAALLIAPDRSPAWLTMAEAFARSGKQPSAIASLRLAVRFSANRQKTIAFLGRIAQSQNDENWRSAAARVAQEAANLP